MTLIRRELATVVGFLILICVVLLGDRLAPVNVGSTLAVGLLFGIFCLMLWLAFSVVRHAECLATLLGEPYGTLILTLSVIGIEVALISSVMLAGADKPTLARDTMFSVLMIVLNGLVGLSLITGGLKHRFQSYNLQGANAYLAVIITLSVLCLILPSFTHSAPGGQLSSLQAVFLVGMSIILYGVFLGIQTVTHSDIFKQPDSDGEEASHAHPDLVIRTVPFHSAALIAAILPIVLLSKTLAVYIDHGLETLNAPLALGGFLIAALVLTPEGLSSIQAARDNQLQRAVNICLGSALATIGLTIPAILTISWLTNETVELGLDSVDIVILSVTLVVSLVTFVSSQTNFLLGMVHLAIFAAYVVKIFDGPA